jgi:hypothetical protein
MHKKEQVVLLDANKANSQAEAFIQIKFIFELKTKLEKSFQISSTF